jgi:hypothetical protein
MHELAAATEPTAGQQLAVAIRSQLDQIGNIDEAAGCARPYITGGRALRQPQLSRSRPGH